MTFDQTSLSVDIAELAPETGDMRIARGQGLIEYALIIVFVALVVALALSLLAPTINSIFTRIPPAL